MCAVIALAAFAACGDDDDDDDGGGSEADKQEIADLLNTIAAQSGEGATQEEIDFYMAHITDEFVQAFGTESLDACAADPETCIGEPLTNPNTDPADVDVNGNAATATIVADEGSFGVKLIKEGDAWKASGLFIPDDDIPEGTEVVDMELVEFAFATDLQSDAIKSGDFALHISNGGEQAHEVLLVALPEEGAIEDLLEDDSFQPEPIIAKLPYAPGDESDAALPAPLDPGRYAFVCFFPDTDDPEMTPHAFKGMVSEFTVE